MKERERMELMEGKRERKNKYLAGGGYDVDG
jgi:hypothetical protein